MKKLLLPLLFLALAAQAQVKQARPLAAFETVQTGGGISVVLTQGPAAVVVEADADTQPHLTTVVEAGALVINWDKSDWYRKGTNHRATVYVSCPRLTALTTGAGAQARGTNTFTADDFQATATSGSQIDLAITAKSFTANASSGSRLTVSGTAGSARYTVSGGTTCLATRLQATSAEVLVTGGSTAEIAVSQTLSAQASGGSSIRYKGSPRVTQKATGGSSVRAI